MRMGGKKMSKLSHEIDSILEWLKNIKIDELKYKLSLHLSDDINGILEMLKVNDYILFKEQTEINRERNKQKIKEVLLKKVNEINEENLFYFYFLVNKIGIFSYKERFEVIKKILKIQKRKKLLKNIIEYLNNLENPYIEEIKDFNDAISLKRAIGYVPSIENPGMLLGDYLSCSEKKEDFNYILRELKIETYLYYLNSFNSQLFFNSLTNIEIGFLKDNKNYVYNFILSVNEIHDNTSISEDEMKSLKRIIKDNLELVGKYIFNEIYFNKYTIEKKEDYNKIFQEILNVPQERERFLNTLEWGEDFQRFSTYLLINENQKNEGISTNDSLKYAKTFLASYNQNHGSFYNYYCNWNKQEDYIMFGMLGMGLFELGEEFLIFLTKEILEIKYQYFSTEYSVILDLNQKISEVIILHLLMLNITEYKVYILDSITKSLKLIENSILEQFIFNLKSTGVIDKKRGAYSWLTMMINLLEKADELNDQNSLKLVLENMLIKFKETGILKNT